MMTEHELIMSDIPWAVAWYGHRQCIWLTLNAVRDPNDRDSRENFLEVNDFRKHISALYLTPETIDSKFLSQWLDAGELSWGNFIANTLLRKQVPPDFPLHQMPEYLPNSGRLLPHAILLADWQRWRKTTE